MIYILLPAYNEEKSLDQIFKKISEFMNKANAKYKIIICNDGSEDNTLKKIYSYKKKLPIEIINHKMNRGLGETSRDLFEKAAEISDDIDILIRMDCDDTHEPEFIGRMLNKLEEGYDVVIASRFTKGGGQVGLSNYRKYISLCANLFMKFFFPIKGLKEYTSGFRAYRASIIKKAILLYGNNFIQLKGMGFTCTLEKIVKLKLIGARFAESPFVLKYNQKLSHSKMMGSITTFGYFVLVVLFYWPWGGWRSKFKNGAILNRSHLPQSVDTF
jgi:dolichol-phosphate mannosyltransferase